MDRIPAFAVALVASLFLNLAIVIPLTVAYLIPSAHNVGDVLAQMAMDSHLIPADQDLVANR